MSFCTGQHAAGARAVTGAGAPARARKRARRARPCGGAARASRRVQAVAGATEGGEGARGGRRSTRRERAGRGGRAEGRRCRSSRRRRVRRPRPASRSCREGWCFAVRWRSVGRAGQGVGASARRRRGPRPWHRSRWRPSRPASAASPAPHSPPHSAARPRWAAAFSSSTAHLAWSARRSSGRPTTRWCWHAVQ